MAISKFQSAHSFKAAVSRLIDAGELDEALRWLHDFVERVFTNPLCTSQIFASKSLDELCQRVGNVNLKTIRQQNPYLGPVTRSPSVFVYVVTKLQKSGGHTRIIEDLINARNDAQHVILSTELTGKSDAGYWTERLAKRARVEIELCPKGGYRQRLTWLQRNLLARSPVTVYLLNHHQDSVAVAAIQPEMKLNAKFYHHGDHHLCLGVHLPHLDHIDFHSTGYWYCRNQLGIENTFIPLTANDRGTRPQDWTFMEDGLLTTCTAAKSNKIEIPYFVSYLELIAQLLEATGGRHVHIGRLSPWALYRIRSRLKELGVAAERFIYTPWVPSVWEALNEQRVDLYVASFPYGGGLTLIEAMGAGVPVALHRHMFSRVLSGLDLAYPGAFSWRFPEELLGYCRSLSPDDLQEGGRLGRKHFETYHSQEIFESALRGQTELKPPPNDLSIRFSVEHDEWALWVERQIGVKGIVSRAAYRTLRRVRAWCC